MIDRVRSNGIIRLVYLVPMVALVSMEAVESIVIDAGLDRHPINPLIYGVSYGSGSALADLNCPLVRWGGNHASRYNWKINASNRGFDWYFESIGENDSAPSALADAFIATAKSNGAEPMMTIPMIGWVADLGPNRGKRCSFSQVKYGLQTRSDKWMSDAGNGVLLDGRNVVGNDPYDANVVSDVAFQRDWISHLVGKFGLSSQGGLRYYILDNEHSLWNSTHRDVHPKPVTAEEAWSRMWQYASAVKKADGDAMVVGPEEWGWISYLFSGSDTDWLRTRKWQGVPPEKSANGGMDYVAWILKNFRLHEERCGKRILDVFSLHYYPEGGENSDVLTVDMQARRNRSTRSLWDPDYVDESWINAKIRLIPRMKDWVKDNYPGTATAITEYNWGAETHINGATAQADVLGIFGREGLDMAARWTAPAVSTPTYQAIKMYRNYDGMKSTFGDQGVRATATLDADVLSVFASVRSGDGALTAIVINKSPLALACNVKLRGFIPGKSARIWQLTSGKSIEEKKEAPMVVGGQLEMDFPSQSVTLLVFQMDDPATIQEKLHNYHRMVN